MDFLRLLFLPALGIIATAGCADVPSVDGTSTANDAERSVSAAQQAPAASSAADGFASVNALGQRGTTGGAGGTVVTATSQAELERYAAAPEPYVVRVRGMIAVEPFGKEIRVSSNKTIIGVGKASGLMHGGFNLNTVQNVIIRNLTIRDSYVEGDEEGKTQDYDGVQVDDSHHVWIDHCHFHRMGDGILDLRKTTDYVTVSWNIMSDHNKVFGLGWTEQTDKLHVTIHHNWIRNTKQRNPSFDNGTGHLYNNLLQNITSYGNYARGKTKLVVENSVFEKVRNPLQRDADAQLVARGNRLNESSGRNEPKGAAFDPRSFYPYRLDPVDQVSARVRAASGPQADIGSELGD